MDTAGRRGNPSQLETDVAERRGTWTSLRVVATDHSSLRVMMMMMMTPVGRRNDVRAPTAEATSLLFPRVRAEQTSRMVVHQRARNMSYRPAIVLDEWIVRRDYG